MPMIPPQPARGGRSCANCACFYELPHPKNPLEKQGYCAKLPAIVGQVRLQVPRLDKDGKPVVVRDRPLMDSIEDLAFTHQPTCRALVCMDGWRPVGTLPGNSWASDRLDRAMRRVFEIMHTEDLSQMPAGGLPRLLEAIERELVRDPLEPANDAAEPEIPKDPAAPLNS